MPRLSKFGRNQHYIFYQAHFLGQFFDNPDLDPEVMRKPNKKEELKFGIAYFFVEKKGADYLPEDGDFPRDKNDSL